MQACTIVARNYLPQARVLARSFQEHHPGVPFTVLVIDDPAPAAHAEHFAVLGLDDIGLEPGEAERMALIYDVTEFATAVKPWLLRRLLRSGPDVVLYFDPDIEIFAPLFDLATLARAHSIILTPHVLEPFPQDGLQPTESTIMGTGIYNLGFIAVGPGGEAFFDWWAARLRRDSIIDPANMRFTDQRWIDFVPALFPHHILRDRACNVAYWNLTQRELSWTGREYRVSGQPLRFFHYSGYEPSRPTQLSKFQGDPPRVRLESDSALAKLCTRYREQLLAEDFEKSRHEQYRYGAFGNGLPIDRPIRRAYRSALIRHEAGDGAEPPNPFLGADPNAFVEWVTEPLESASAIITRYMLATWDVRPDLRDALPDPLGRDAPALYEWSIARSGDQPLHDPAFNPRLNAAQTEQVASARFGRPTHRQEIIGKTIDFRRGGNSEPYRLGGWGRSEDEFTWSIGRSAHLALPIPEATAPLELELLLAAFIQPPKLPTQRLELWLQDEKVARWNVAQRSVFRVGIPVHAMRGRRVLVLEFRTPDATAPRDVLPSSADPRTLGISLYSLRLIRPSLLRRTIRAVSQ
jgi:hypothetical protein